MKNDNSKNNNSNLTELNNETNLNDLEPKRSTRTKKTTSAEPAMSDQDRKIIGLANRGFDANRIAAMLMVNLHTVKETINKY